MPMNQAYDRLYSDKVSKFAIFGPISNFARSLQRLLNIGNKQNSWKKIRDRQAKQLKKDQR